MNRSILFLVLVLGFLGSTLGVSGQTTHTWDGTGPWINGAPSSSILSANDFFVVQTGTCTLSGAIIRMKNLTIQSTGILNNNSDVIVRNLIVNGTLINNQTFTISSKFSISGSITNAVNESSYYLFSDMDDNNTTLEISKLGGIDLSQIITGSSSYKYLNNLVVNSGSSINIDRVLYVLTATTTNQGTLIINDTLKTKSLVLQSTNTISGTKTLQVRRIGGINGDIVAQANSTTTISCPVIAYSTSVASGGTINLNNTVVDTASVAIDGTGIFKTNNTSTTIGSLILTNGGTYQSIASSLSTLNITTVSPIHGNFLLNSNTSVGTFPSSITVNGTNSRIDYLTAKYVNFISSATLGNATLDSMDISDGKTLTLSNPVTINKHVKVFLNGVLASGGNLTLNDDAALYFTNNNSVTGNVNIKRNLTYQGLTYFGSSLDYAVSNFGADWIGQYVESNNPGNERFVKVIAGNLSRGTGYNRSTSAAREFTVTGIPDISNLSIPLSYTTTNTSTSNGQRGFNLVSNPYTAPISIPQFFSNNRGLSQSIQLWDNNGNSTGTGDYIVVDFTGLTTGGMNSGHITSAGKGYLAPQQGFFVKANNSGLSANFTGTQVTSALNNNFLKSTIAQDYIRLNLKSASGLTNEIIVRFIGGATDDFDNSYDAYKIKGNTKISLYSKLSTDDLIIQSFAPILSQKEIKIGVRATTDENYTFKVPDFSNIDPETRIYLKDIKAGKFIDLRTSDYTIQLSGDTIDSRFLLVFSKNDITATKSISEESEYSIYNSNNSWYIDFKKELFAAKVQAFDLQGRMLYNEEVKHYVGSYPLNYNFKSGSVYILKISSAKSIYTQKIVTQ